MVRRVRPKFRPNVVPAKNYYKRNSVQRSADQMLFKTQKGKIRFYIEDLCDYCLKPRFVRRTAMRFRKEGHKFLCNECADAGKGKFGKGTKNIICFTKERLFIKFKYASKKN